MPGGGGRKASNFVARNARPDGLTLGNVGSGLIANAVLGSTGVEYDIDKLIYLGAANSTAQYVFGSVTRLGLDSLDKLRAHPGLCVGAQTVGHDIYINGRLFRWILGLKDPKFVTGYSGPELDLAMDRGELDARANIPDTICNATPSRSRNVTSIFMRSFRFPRTIAILTFCSTNCLSWKASLKASVSVRS